MVEISILSLKRLFFRNKLIANQRRINGFLGIKEPEQEKTNQESENEQFIQESEEQASADEDQDEEIYDSQGEMTEPPLDDSQIKLENVESEDEYQEVQSEMELIEEEEEQPINSETEELLESYEEEMETTIDQLEEDFQLDENSDDYQVCYVNNEEEDYVEYGGEILMEVPQTAKRKYTKHTKESAKPYQCWIKNCGATFAFRTTMKKHMQLQHSIVCQKSTCFICGNSYDDYADFLSHVKEHTRKSECDICKLRFVSDEKMMKHKAKFHKSDDEGRNFECNVS